MQPSVWRFCSGYLNAFFLVMLAGLVSAPAQSAPLRAVRVVEKSAQQGTLLQLAARDPALAATLDKLTAEAKAKGRVKLTVKLAVAFAPEKLLSVSDQAMQRRDLAAAVLAVRQALPHAQSLAQRPGLPYIDLTLDAAGLAKLQTLPGLSRIARPQDVSWFKDYMTIRSVGGTARPPARSRDLTSVSLQAEVPRDADPDTHPFHVALLYVEDALYSDFIFCSGALVAERFVVTTAFCVDAIDDPVTHLNILVTRRADGSGQRFQVKHITIHPQYDWAFETSPNLPDYDIAVIELATPVTGVPLAAVAATPLSPGTPVRKTSFDTLEATGKILQGDEVLSPAVNGMCGNVKISPRLFCTQPQAGQGFFGWGLGANVTIEGRAGGSQLVGLSTLCDDRQGPCENKFYVNVANPDISRFILDTIAAGDHRIGFAAPRRFTTEAGDDLPPVTPVPGTPAWQTALNAALARGKTTVWVVRASGQGAAYVRYRTVAVTAQPRDVPAGFWWNAPATRGDYVPTSGVITFASGQTLAKIDVWIVDDDVPEGFEGFSVLLSDPSPGWSIDNGTMMVTIDLSDGYVYQ